MFHANLSNFSNSMLDDDKMIKIHKKFLVVLLRKKKKKSTYEMSNEH